ncbi:MAG: FAD-binding oxidoreductase [Chlorobi bacterium]|uniref:FAD-binding oxidoreductase n=2 Tax=Chryseobacterium TaxID=59732 RepID=A0AAJ1VNK9_9FLAO|nr:MULTISPECIES: FAD-binding protein [Chryseobacterium]NPA08063.1 FAD-binding oxidoreductase [Chlorobiota bacterium]MCF2219923.1 FAD-binding protein [Chryseobacterium sp. PS-8]MDN4013984.1 FAD-binding oxidoreductase [Chryseobacterium gambrini]MDN4031999.1 FAD-binding oxidoreductase [Chryseobacterium gambrini]QWA38334.1 FAD-binding protein [Chryseobacterium sp. ZHDP1]
MKPNFVQKVTNWGNFPIVEKEMKSEDSFRKIKEFVQNHNEVIARGNGRCYGDSSLGEHIFSTKKLNKFISFDRLNGIIECESGVLLSDVLEIAVPQGYFLYVTPGTKFVSVGGAIASDVHGKNHHAEGCFSEYVIEFKLMIENGDIINCSREENSDKFWATIGGMGLTGIILTAKFKLKNIESAYIRQESIKAENLDEIFNLFEESESWTYTVAWIDCLQKGKNIGRSILMRGEHAFQHELPQKFKEKPLRLKKKFEPTVPFYFPGFVLNALTVKIFNYFYYKKQSKKEVKNFIDYETFFYPLDFVHDWNKIYGKSGFIQYQMMIPKESGKEGMKKILETIANSGNGSFLAVLKLYGKENPEAYNSFPFEGYSLALDFKVNSKLKKLIDQLDDIVEQYNGKIYLTKDSMSRSSLTNYLKNVQSSKFVSLQHKRILNNI